VRAFIVLNPRCGSLTRSGVEGAIARLEAVGADHGIAMTVAVASGDRIADEVRGAIVPGSDGNEPRFDAVAVGGGDGSISAAASVLAGTDIPLTVLPLGTFNHFARDLGLPLDLDAALALVAHGHAKSVDVGELNGRVFLNNSSLGIYPHLVVERDRVHRRGPARWGAAALAFCRVLWRLPTPRLRLRARGREVERKTPCLFIGNNLYELDAFAVARRSRLDDGALCLYIAHRHSRLALLYLAVRAFLGRLEPDRDFTLRRLDTVEVSSRRHRLPVALDGEVLIMETPLRYRIRPRALRVIVPAPVAL
jgi:diacylglycerol kinase family enzyme